MQVGMVVSNEPGYYEDGAFGIRIENLLITKEADTPFRYAGQTYMCFEPLTFCPIQRKMLALKVHCSYTRYARETCWIPNCFGCIATLDAASSAAA